MIDYNKLIQKYDTPLFVYDIDELHRRVNYLKSKFKSYNMVYAVKANTFVIKEIDSLVKDHTIIIVAHRLSTIVDADVINVIDKGRLASSGTHNELLKCSSVYKKLYTNESSNS